MAQTGDVESTRTGVFGEELATHYDESRHIGDDGARELTRLLAAELRGRGLVLEIGVGTGRVALPLARDGIPMLGLDPSLSMLRRLVQKGGGRPPFGLLRGDGTRLPFGDGVLGAAVFCHVLHLIPDWRGALREASRVLRPDGRLLLERRERSDDAGRQLHRHFHEVLEFEPTGPIGVRDSALVDSTLVEMGWREHALPAVVATEEITLGGLIDRMERGVTSSQLSIPPADRQRGWAETRRWAEAELGPLQQTVRLRREVIWHVYRREMGVAT